MSESRSHAAEADLRERFERETTPLLRGLHLAARQLTVNAVDAEDLVQDTLLKAYSGFQTYQPDTHMRAWLLRIMRNVWIDDHRRSTRRPVEWLTGDVNSLEFNAYHRGGPEADIVEAHLIGSPFTDALCQALRELPKNLGRALYYAYVEGFAYKEIAHMERIPVGTVMSRLYRARHAMRAALVENMPGSSLAELGKQHSG